jgi:hypothetical protein
LELIVAYIFHIISILTIPQEIKVPVGVSANAAASRVSATGLSPKAILSKKIIRLNLQPWCAINKTHIRPGEDVTVGVCDGQNVPVNELLESRVGENLIDDPQAHGRTDPFTGVQSAVDPDGFLAGAGRYFEHFHVAAFGGGSELLQGDESGVGVGQLVQQGVNFVEFHEAVVNGGARPTARLLLDDLVLGTLFQDGAASEFFLKQP